MAGTPEMVERALAQLPGAADAEARAAALAPVCGPDAHGEVPLEAYLAAGGADARRRVAEALRPAAGEPAVFAAAFAGLSNPHCRALAGLLSEMAACDPALFASTLTGCLYAREPHVQRAGLNGLLEVPEEIARPILAQFPEELAAPAVADSYREVNTTFEVRRTFRNHGVAYYPLRCLGQGGMGAVWLARDLAREPRLAALKFLKAGPDGSFQPDLLARFEREARVPLLLDHPGLLRVRDHGQSPGLHWIDEDFVQGGTLQDRLEREGRLEWPEVVQLATQVADALDHLHGKRVVHRDLKPANLFLTGDRRVVLGDFGLVHIADAAVQAEVPGFEATQAHLILGSIGYMSPEQASSSPVDGRADLFALGVIMYRALAGVLPYPGANFRDYVKSLNGTANPARLPAPVPRALDALVERLLQRAPEDRPQSAAAVAAELRRLDRAGVADADTTILDARLVAPVRTTGQAVSPDADTSAFVAAPEPAPPPTALDRFLAEVSGPAAPRPEDIVAEAIATTVEPPPEPPPPAPAPAVGAPSSTAAEFAAAYAGGAQPARMRTRPDPLTPEGRAAAARGLRPPAEERGWCPTCRKDTESAVEGCVTCRGIEAPWAPTVLKLALAALGAYCLAPLVLDRIAQAPRLAPIAGSRLLTVPVGAGAVWLALGLARLRNWAYVAGTALTAAVGVLAGGAAVALGRAVPPPPHLTLGLARLAGLETGGRGADFALRLLRDQCLHKLAVAGGAALLLAAFLMARDCRHTFRRNWTRAALASAAGALALIVVPLALVALKRW